MEEVKQELFIEFFICPHCKNALMSKEELQKATEEGRMNYCTMCGKQIASVYNKALEQVKS